MYKYSHSIIHSAQNVTIMLETFQSLTLFSLPLLGRASSFNIPMVISIAIAALMIVLAIFSVVLASVCILRQRKQLRERGKD